MGHVDCIRVAANSRIAEKLQIEKLQPILNRIKKAYAPGKWLVEFCISYYLADKFFYTINIRREF